MNKISKEKRDKVMLTIVMASFACLAFYVFVVSPQRTEIRQNEEKLADVFDRLETAERWLRMGPAVRTNLLARTAALGEQEVDMAPLDKFKWFYNTLESFRSRYDVNLVDITREPFIADVTMIPKFAYRAAIFDVKLSATYHDFGKFLADFENQFPLMRVQDLRMDLDAAQRSVGTNGVVGAGQEKDKERLAISLKVVTLVKPPASL